MIYSTNRTQSLGDVNVAVNENYFGNGYLDFVQECYEDELAIFESVITSDIDEFITEGAELEAVCEAFVSQAKEKIVALMTKFLEWIESVKKSVVKKYDELYNKSVSSKIKELSDKMKDSGGTFSGKAFTSTDVLDVVNNIIKDIADCKSIVTGEVTKDGAESIAKKVAALKETDKKVMSDSLIEVKDKPAKEVFDTQKKIAEAAKQIISEVRGSLDEQKAVAKQIVKECKKSSKDDKDASALKLQAAGSYRTLCVESLKTTMKVLKHIVSEALSVMQKCVKATAVKEEAALEDIEMMELATEAFIYEMEAALEDYTTEGCKNEGCKHEGDEECCDGDEECCDDEDED